MACRRDEWTMVLRFRSTLSLVRFDGRFLRRWTSREILQRNQKRSYLTARRSVVFGLKNIFLSKFNALTEP